MIAETAAKICLNYLEDLGYSDDYKNINNSYIKKVFCDNKEGITSIIEKLQYFKQNLTEIEYTDLSIDEIFNLLRIKNDLIINFFNFFSKILAKKVICFYINKTDFKKLLINIESKYGITLEGLINDYKKEAELVDGVIDTLSNFTDFTNIEDLENKLELPENEQKMESLKILLLKILFELFEYYNVEGEKLEFKFLTTETKDDILSLDLDDFLEDGVDILDYFILINEAILNSGEAYSEYSFNQIYNVNSFEEYFETYNIFNNINEPNFLKFDELSLTWVEIVNEFLTNLDDFISELIFNLSNDNNFTFSELLSVIANFKKMSMEFLNKISNKHQYNLYSFLDYNFSKKLLFLNDKHSLSNYNNDYGFIHRDKFSENFYNIKRGEIKFFSEYFTCLKESDLIVKKSCQSYSYNLAYKYNIMKQIGYQLKTFDENLLYFNLTDEEKKEEIEKQKNIVYNFLIDRVIYLGNVLNIRLYDNKSKDYKSFSFFEENLKEDLKILKEYIEILEVEKFHFENSYISDHYSYATCSTVRGTHSSYGGYSSYFNISTEFDINNNDNFLVNSDYNMFIEPTVYLNLADEYIFRSFTPFGDMRIIKKDEYNSVVSGLPIIFRINTPTKYNEDVLKNYNDNFLYRIKIKRMFNNFPLFYILSQKGYQISLIDDYIEKIFPFFNTSNRNEDYDNYIFEKESTLIYTTQYLYEKIINYLKKF